MKFIPPDLYKRIIGAMPISCVDLAIIIEGQVLIGLRKNVPAQGQWWFPGGRILKNETMVEAAYRKALEETGIKCHVGSHIYTGETIFSKKFHTINNLFLMYPINKIIPIKLDSQHCEYKLVNRIDSTFHPYIKKCISILNLKKVFKKGTYAKKF